MRSGFWHDCTTTDFAGIDPDTTVALLPVAAVEQHGPHLPLATDAIINDGLVRAALALQPATPALLVLPTLTIGLSTEHVAYPGTLTVADHTLADVWTDIGRSVARAGVRKLIILNTHGGQKALVDLVAVRLRAELKMLVARATYFAFGSPQGLFAANELIHDIHGGEVETSLLLHLRPDLVRTSALADFRGLPHDLASRNKWLGAEKPVGIGWLSGDLHPQGACGNAARADAKRGEAQLAHLAAALVRLVGEVAATPLSILR